MSALTCEEISPSKCAWTTRCFVWKMSGTISWKLCVWPLWGTAQLPREGFCDPMGSRREFLWKVYAVGGWLLLVLKQSSWAVNHCWGTAKLPGPPSHVLKSLYGWEPSVHTMCSIKLRRVCGWRSERFHGGPLAEGELGLLGSTTECQLSWWWLGRAKPMFSWTFIPFFSVGRQWGYSTSSASAQLPWSHICTVCSMPQKLWVSLPHGNTGSPMEILAVSAASVGIKEPRNALRDVHPLSGTWAGGDWSPERG